MGLIQLPNTFVHGHQLPSETLVWNLAHPLLLDAIIAKAYINGFWVNLLTNKPAPVQSGVITRSYLSQGCGVYTGFSVNQAVDCGAITVSDAALSILGVMSRGSASTGDGLISAKLSGGNGVSITPLTSPTAIFRSNDSTDKTTSGLPSGTLVPKPFAVTADNTTGTFYYGHDSASVSGTFTATTLSGSQNLFLGKRLSTYRAVWCNLIIVLPRTISAREYSEFLSHPYQMFRPAAPRIWVPVSSGGATDITVADSAHGHAADGLTLTTAAVLTVADGQHGHAADLATLSTNWLLTVADAASAHLADGPALTVASVLAVADALHAHISDSLGLSTNWLLTVADATHGQAADNVLLDTSLATTLTAQDASHGHAADVLTLVTNWLLAVSDAAHGHSADALTLSATGATSLILADAVHAHLADELGLTTATTLAILEAIHAHAAEALVLFFSSFTQAQLDEILAYVEANMAVPTANEIAIAVWQMVLEGALTAEQMQRIMLAALAGKRQGLGTANEQYMGLDGVTPRVTFTPSDAAGNGTTAVDGS